MPKRRHTGDGRQLYSVSLSPESGRDPASNVRALGSLIR